MAYAFVQQNAADNAASAATITVTLTPTAGNLLVLCISGDSADTTSIALSDNLGTHNTFTQIGTDLVTASAQRCAWWFAANCKGGATTFTATFSSGTRFRTFYVAEYSGITTTSPLLNGARAENGNPGTGADAVSSGNANATSQPALVWGFNIDTDGSAAASAGTGFTSRTSVWSSATCFGRPEDKRVTATGNVAATFTAVTGTDTYGTGVGIFAEVVTPVFDDDSAPVATRFVPWVPIRAGADSDESPAAVVGTPSEAVPIGVVPRSPMWLLPWPTVVEDDLPTGASPTMVDDGESVTQTATIPFAPLPPWVTDEDFPGTAPVGSMLDEDSTPSMLVASVLSLVPSRDASDGELPSVASTVDDSVGVVVQPGAMAFSPPRAAAGDELAQFVAPAASSTIFPLKISGSGRYLEQADGTPFLLCADTTWSLFVDIPLASVSTYFGTLVSQGFNAVMGNVIEHHYTTVKPPKERGGLLPFTQRMDGTSFTGSPNGTTGTAGTQGQFASDNYSNINNQAPDCTFINNSYWLAVEQILDAALANNLAVLVWPGYLGFHSNDEGWLNEMVAWDAVTGAGGFTGLGFANPAKSKMWNYGAWMAARWKNYPNIIWVMGGDYGSNTQTLDTSQSAAVSNLMAGLKSVAGQQSTLFSAHWDRPALSTDTVLAAGSFDLNGCYADESVAELARRGFAASPTKPTIGLEYFYEDDLFGGSAPFRKYVYWQFLGGVAGGHYGNEQLWRFDDGTPGTDWSTLLATQARNDAVRQFSLWKSLPWHRLKPSGLGGMGTIVTAGGGTASPQSTDYVAAAATANGDLLLAYVPPAHTGTITVDMTKMVATCRARWFDPSNGSFTAIGTIANTGTHAFTTPATNSAGDTDFLLVLDITGAELDDGPPNWPGVLVGPGAVSLRVTRDDELSFMVVDEDGPSWMPASPLLAATRASVEDEPFLLVLDEPDPSIPLPRDWSFALPLRSIEDESLFPSIVDDDSAPLVLLVRDWSILRAPTDDDVPAAVMLDDIDGRQPATAACDAPPAARVSAGDDLPSTVSPISLDDIDAQPATASPRDWSLTHAPPTDDDVPIAAASILDDIDGQQPAGIAPMSLAARAATDDDVPSQVVEDTPWTFAIAWPPAPLLVRIGTEEIPGTLAPPPTFGLDDDQLGAVWPLPWIPALPLLAQSSDELAVAPPTVDPTTAWEDAIYQWVLTGSGLAPDHVIWASAGAGGPAPAGLYISMRIIDVDQVSDDWLIPRRVGGGIVHHVRGTRHPTLELRCFAGESTGARRAELVLARVMAAVMLPSVSKALRKGDVGVGSSGPVRVINGTRSGMLDPLAMVEVPLHIKIDVSEAGAEFTSVGVTTLGVAQTVEKP